MKKNISVILLFFLWLSSHVTISGQTLNEARELYKIGEYAKALPVFEKEYNAKPNDASLNQWYGVCLYQTGGNLAQAEKCITFAASKNIQDAYLYLGKIYTRTYRFDKAEAEFAKYAKLKRRDKDALASLQKEEEYLSALRKSVQRTEDIQIIDSVVVNKKDFLSAYKLTPTSGRLEYYDNVFQADASNSTVYYNEKETKMYYGQSTEKDKYKLFSMEKLFGNEFGNQKQLSESNFGLSGSSNYPFVMTDGVTIYFSAEDSEGLGGYDIYVTRYNMNNDAYLTPERLNAPFNSLFNDYMMAIDEEKGIGWFASDRFQPEGKVCIYTFIPNEQTIMVESNDEKQLISRAIISSIKDSWEQGANYTNLINIARKDIQAKQKIDKDFVFVINDKYTYFKLSDFKNTSARETFHQANELSKRMKEEQTTLDKLRESYSVEPSQKKGNEILDLENRQLQLYNKIKELELNARNLEASSIK